MAIKQHHAALAPPPPPHHSPPSFSWSCDARMQCRWGASRLAQSKPNQLLFPITSPPLLLSSFCGGEDSTGGGQEGASGGAAKTERARRHAPDFGQERGTHGLAWVLAWHAGLMPPGGCVVSWVVEWMAEEEAGSACVLGRFAQALVFCPTTPILPLSLFSSTLATRDEEAHYGGQGWLGGRQPAAESSSSQPRWKKKSGRNAMLTHPHPRTLHTKHRLSATQTEPCLPTFCTLPPRTSNASTS
jgi:hypothetical protein